MSEKYLLISGRAGAGKTELLIAYANMYPKTTLLISEEYLEEDIIKRGLSNDVKIVSAQNLNIGSIKEYSTICIDYIEVFEKAFINNLLNLAINEDIRIIAVSQMKATDYSVMTNIFQNCINK